MSMSKQSAQNAVATSAFVVFGVWAYRKLTEGNASPPGEFLTGFFVVYLSLAVVAQAAPPLGGMFAWLVAAGDLLTNGQGLVNDLNKGLKRTAAATAPATTTTPAKGG